ncbi:MAG: DUF1570 domain-containing protein [Planctomycetaceae bacterium]
MSALIACLFMTVLIQADEPPRETGELTPDQRLHRVTWTDAKSETRSVAGRVLLKAQDGGLVLEGRDGRLWNVTPKQLQQHETTDELFQPLKSEELGQQLSREVAALGIKTPTQVVITKHYVICSTAGQKYGEWCGSVSERLHDAFLAYWKTAGLELHEPEFPLPVIVLKDHAQFTDFAAKHDRPDAAQSPGYFSEPTNRIILFDLTAGPNSPPAQTAADIQRKIATSPFNVVTMIHEATHQLAFNSGLQTRYADNPRWLTEGLAMFFEVPDLDSRSGWKTIGKVNAPRRKDFRETSRSPREAISLAELIRADDVFLQPDKARAAYAESWALTYFLLKTRRDDVVSYLKTIQRKPRLIADSPEDRVREFEKEFGETGTLEREWKKWMATH